MAHKSKTSGGRVRKSTSLLSKIMIPMIVLLLLQTLALGILLTLNGGFSYIKKSSYSLLSEKTGNRKTYVENVFNQKTSQVYEAANEVNRMMEELLRSKGLTAAAVQTDRGLNREILDRCAESLISLIRRDMVNDAFIILDSGTLYDEGEMCLRPGIYLRDTDVEENSISDNKDIFMEMGSSETARSFGLALDFEWSLHLNITDSDSGNYDFFFVPLNSHTENSNTPLYNLGYWSGLSRISASQQESIKYTLPLVAEDGTVYGVIGIGMLEKTIQKSIPSSDFSDGSTCYILGLDAGGSGKYQTVLHRGSSYARLIRPDTVLSTENSVGYNLYDLTVKGGPEVVGSIQKLNLYKSGSPYRNQNWALISVADKDMILVTYYALIRTFVVSMLVTIVFGIIVAVVISERINMPVARMIGTLNESRSEHKRIKFNSSGISEIDLLGEAIADLQVDVAEYASRVKDDEYTAKLIEANSALKAAFAAAKQANDAKTDFLSRMSHDIRTPMNAIIGMTAIAQCHLDDRGKLEDCFNKISVSSRYLLALINEVLDMSKIEGGKFVLAEENVNLLELADNLIELIKPSVKAKQQELTVETGHVEHADVIGDSLRIQQVFMNIMSNAVKYTPEGGHIIFRLSEKATVQQKVGCYEFVFTDNGKGMSPEFLKKVFLPFEREEDERVSKEQGTGLGMTIAYNIVKLMNGDIRVESEVNKGTTFTVTLYLPLNEGEQQTADVSAEEGKSGVYAEAGTAAETGTHEKTGTAAETGMREKAGIAAETGNHTERSMGAEVQPAAGTPMESVTVLNNMKEVDYSAYRVLLVEDNELNREIAEEILRMTKLNVETAENGKEAVEKFSLTAPGYYDMILMDIQMPVMNGYGATRAIRALEREDAKTVPIVAMTANAFAEDVRDSEEAGMNEHIAKPLDPGKLFATLNKWLINKNKA